MSPQAAARLGKACGLALLGICSSQGSNDNVELALVDDARRDGFAQSRRLQHHFMPEHTWAAIDYLFPSNGSFPIGTWYNTIVPLQSSEDTFFAVLGNRFSHMGLQQAEKPDSLLGFEGKALFSIWDTGCDHVLGTRACASEGRARLIECGSLFVCSRFQESGAGVQAYMRFNDWKPHRTYSFVMRASRTTQDQVLFEGYFHADELRGWVLMAKIQVQIEAGASVGEGTSAFVERLSSRSPGDPRWACFGPAYAKPSGARAWTRALQANISAAVSGSSEGVEGNTTQGRQWCTGIGGEPRDFPMQHDSPPMPQALTPPSDLDAFDELDRADELPKGCSGGTCSDVQTREFFRQFLTSEHLPVTMALCGSILALCCGFVACLVCNRVNQALSLLARQASPGPADSGRVVAKQGSVTSSPCLLTGKTPRKQQVPEKQPIDCTNSAAPAADFAV